MNTSVPAMVLQMVLSLPVAAAADLESVLAAGLTGLGLPRLPEGPATKLLISLSKPPGR